MKNAIILCGNLRTFLMPQQNGKRLCDDFIENIVKPNNADVFIFTNTNDFYYDDVQYFSTDRRIEILNDQTCRLHNKIDFIKYEEAFEILRNELVGLFGENLGSLTIESPYDATTDIKYNSLKNFNATGNNPELVIQQLRQWKLCYQNLINYEYDFNFKYDNIIKWRFDNAVNGPLNLAEYQEADIYVPGIHSPIIYDWFAYGNRKSMHSYLSIYDILGADLNHVYLCSKCPNYFGPKNHICYSDNEMYEISLSVEYHLFKALKNIKLKNSRYQSSPVRYNNLNIPISDIVKNATVVTYKPGIEVMETKYD